MTTDTTAVHAACLNCGTLTAGRYCQACGQRAGLTRFTLAKLLHEIPHTVFHVDRGFFATMKALARRPGGTIRAYLDGQRVRFYNPLAMLVLTAGLSALLFSTYPFQFPVASAPGLPPEFATKWQAFSRLTFKFYSLSLIFYLPLVAAITWSAFAKVPAARERTYGEHLIVNAYINAFTSAMMVLAFPLFVALNRTPAFGATWNVFTALLILYYVVALFLVFKSPGKWFYAAMRSVLAVFLFQVMTILAMMAVFWLIYAKL